MIHTGPRVSRQRLYTRTGLPHYTLAVAELKTQVTKKSVSQFLDSIADEQRRAECQTISAMMAKATRTAPAMWGPSIVGFGNHEYAGANGKTNKWFQVGFSPRKQALTLYLVGGKDQQLLAKLGKQTTGAGCLYIKSLDDVHQPTLQKLTADSVKRLKAHRKK